MHKRLTAICAAGAFFVLAAGAAAWGFSSHAKPFVFDPGDTELVQSSWLGGIGCPTGASTFDGTSKSSYTDPACTTGDRKDKSNEGLLLAKTGPTANVASAGVILKKARSTLRELGYDIRKPVSSADPRGSHCGAGAPRFNIEAKSGTTYFLGCNSPPPTTQTAGNGWLRLRWGGTAPLMAFNATTGALENISAVQVKRLSIVFDEGQDTGPDNFGLAVLDNIDVNGSLIGRGSDRKSDHGHHKGHKGHKHHK
jgi:hypothetical protein